MIPKLEKLLQLIIVSGHALAPFVEVLRYKPKGRRLDRVFFLIFIDIITAGLTQPLREMSTRNISCGIKVAGT